MAGLAVPGVPELVPEQEEMKEGGELQESGGQENCEALELENNVYKVLAKLPLFMINFECGEIPTTLNEEAMQILAASTEDRMHHIKCISEKALTGPMVWNGVVHNGDMFAQLLAFSGREALDCLRKGARENWSIQRFIDQGYGCVSTPHPHTFCIGYIPYAYILSAHS